MAVDPARAKSLFLAVSDLADPAERAAYLDRACGDDAELRGRVEALLRTNDAPLLPPAEAGGGTSAHVPERLPETEDYGDPTARVGAILAGKYKLIEAIGEGGMGSVYLAQQTEPVKRAVAVKVIKAGMDSKAVLTRFEAERQALAMMDHPNIAKVLDAGTTEGGRPFFVMALVKGQPITRFCDERKLTPRQRLELFVPVCQAIQHAHQKGIIHRDIKPSNVLVALYDDQPVPKVIDFGVAKAAGQTLTDKTLTTGFGAVVGTPEYMSPEQANLNNLDVDTRSDVYSLGVLLYELLTSTTPVDRKRLDKAALLEILRIVRELEAPRPSAKLSTIDTLPSVAANRGTEPAKLSRLMKGELDWIVMKALEKDRIRRYETANGLARDIQRYLADEVVEARPPSAGYRLKKFVRRYKGQVLAASLILLALVAGFAGTTWGLIQSNRQRARAEANFELARTAVDDMYTQVAEKWLSQESRMEPVQREFLLKALRFYEQFAQPGSPSPAVRLEAGKAALRVGRIQHRLGDTAAADAAVRSSIDTLRALADDDARLPVRVELQKSLNQYVWLLWSVGRPPDEVQREARELGESLAANPSAPIAVREELGTTYSVQAIVQMACGRFADAEASHGRARSLRAALAAEDPTLEHREAVGRSHYHFARFLTRIGRYQEAEEEFGRAVEVATAVVGDFPREPRPRVELANDLIERAGLFSLLGRAKECEVDLRRGLAITEALSADFPSVTEYKELLGAIRRDLASVLTDRRQLDEARRAYHIAIADGEALVKDSPAVVSYRWNLCVHLSGLMSLEWSAGRLPAAVAVSRLALALAEELSAKVPARVDYRALAAHRRFELADVLSNLKRPAEAMPVYEKALGEYESLVRDCPGVPEYRLSLALLLTRVGDRHREVRNFPAAEAAYARTLPLAEGLARDFPVVPSYRMAPIAVRTSLGKLAVWRRDAAAARDLLDRSIRELEAELKVKPDDDNSRSYLVSNLGYLAQAQALAGDPAAAAVSARRCEETARISNDMFNCACYLALLFKEVQAIPTPGPDRDELIRTLPDRAIAQLGKLKEAGKEDLVLSLVDTDFDPIRSRPEFQAFRRELGSVKQPAKK